MSKTSTRPNREQAKEQKRVEKKQKKEARKNDPRFKTPVGTRLPNIRKDLNADALFGLMRSEFAKIPDPRPGNTTITLVDILMSGFSVFSLKEPSLLSFDERRKSDEANLKRIFGIERVPCDSRLREVLDLVDPSELRKPFKRVFARLQRGKALEQMRFLGKYYLMSGDGTEYYYSKELGNETCTIKTHHTGSETYKTYHQQVYAVSVVHPDFREVIPFCPEPIRKQDGETKNDCERLAARRFAKSFRRDHPHLGVVMLEDGLHSNGPHLRDLQEQGIHFIIGAKESDHKYLWSKCFEEEEKRRSTNLIIDDPVNPRKRHNFFFANGVPLNKTNRDLKINFLEHWEISLDEKGNEIGKKEKHFAWVTDLEITVENVYDIMRAGRSRWKIENETFNTLKTQGYHLEHNYGLGKQHLRPVLMTLTMLAFLVDQAQQLSCGLFRAAWGEVGSKRALWENMRSIFHMTELDSMETLYKAMAFGFKKPAVISLLNSS